MKFKKYSFDSIADYVFINSGYADRLLMDRWNYYINDHPEIICVFNYDGLIYSRPNCQDDINKILEFKKNLGEFNGLVIKSKPNETNPLFFFDYTADLVSLEFCAGMSQANMCSFKVYNSGKIILLKFDTESG